MFRILAEHSSGLPFGKFGRPIHGALRGLGSPAPAECTVEAPHLNLPLLGEVGNLHFICLHSGQSRVT